MNKIQVMLCSLTNMLDYELWLVFLDDIEKIIGTKLSHLDTKDPIRKKVNRLEDAASYVCDIGELENSRTLFAKFGKSKIEMTIILYKNTEQTANNISIYFPQDIVEKKDGIVVLNDVFEMATRRFKPFYSLCDSVSTIAGKKKSTGFSVDLQAELVGVFWLTYFNDSYTDYFGKGRFKGLPSKSIDGIEGLFVRLGETPFCVEM